MTIRRFEGRILDRAVAADLSTLTVQVWDHRRRFKTPVAVVGSDKEGRFAVQFDDLELKGLFGDFAPVMFFRVLSTTSVLASTERSLKWDGRQDGRGNIELRTDRPIGTDASTVRYVIEGHLVNGDGDPVNNTEIRVLERRLGSGVVNEELLEPVASTRTNGSFRLSVTPVGVTPDLIVRAVNGAGATITEKSICRAQPMTRVELVTTGAEPARRVRYNALIERVGAFIGSGPLENLTAAQIDHVACRLDEPRDEVDALVSAAKLTTTTPAVPKEIYFGLILQRLPNTADGIFAHRIPVLKRALLRAVDARQVPAAVGTNIAAHVTALEDRAAGTATTNGVLFQAVAGKAPLGVLVATLTTTELSLAQQKAFVRLAIGDEQSSEEFWQAVEGTFGTTAAFLLKFTRDAAALVGNHVPALQQLQSRRRGGSWSATSKIASLTGADWDAIIAAAGTPSGVTAADYKAAIMKNVERRFRTAWIAARLNEQESGGAFTNFFNSNPTFDFTKTRADSYFAEISSTPAQAVVERLKKTERLFRVTDNWAELKAVYDADYGSSFEIHAKGLAGFQSSVSLNPAAAKAIFDKACWIVNAGAGMVLKYTPATDKISLKSLPTAVLSGVTLPPQVADWGTLFGSPDACACEHCQSVFSPSAYLVDLLQFLRRQSVSPGVTALDKLFERRPDLKRLLLTCDDAHVALPYVDIVNEVLELKLAEDSPSNWPTTNVEVRGTSAELRAHPEIKYPSEHVDAYNALANAVHPFSTPFHLWVEEARTYLEHLGVRRHRLIELLGASATAADWAATECLRITLLQRTNLITSTAPADAWKYWGYTSSSGYPSSLSGVPLFLSRSGLAFEQLQELVTTRWAKASPALTINEGTNCNLAEMTLSNLDPAPSGSRPWFLQRFLRLRLALGWTITDLERVLGAFAPSIGVLSASQLVSIGYVLRLTDRFAASPVELAAFWSKMDTHEGWAASPSLFRGVFIDKRVEQPAAGLFETILATGTSTGSLRAQTPALLAALELSDAELRLLLDERTAWSELGLQKELAADVLDLPSLSRLYRVAKFARVTGHSVRDVLAVRALAGVYGLVGDRLDTEPVPDAKSTPAHTIELADILDVVSASAFSVDEILYLLREVPVPADRLRPAPATLATWDADILANVNDALVKGSQVSDLDGSVFQKLLDEIYGVATIPALGDPVGVALKKILTDAPNGSALTEAQQDAAIDLYLGPVVESTTDAKTRLKASSSSKLPTFADRATYLAQRLVRYVAARAGARQWLATTFGLDAETATHLSESGVLDGPGTAASLMHGLLPGSTPSLPLASPTERARMVLRFYKAALIVKRLGLSPREVKALWPNGGSDPNGLPFLDLDKLPVEFPALPANPEADLAGARALFAPLLRLLKLSALRDRWPGGVEGLFDLFANSAGLDAALDMLAAQTGWGRADLGSASDNTTLAGRFGLTGASLRNEQAILRIEEAVGVLTRLGASAKQAIGWTDLAAALPASGAELGNPPAGQALGIAQEIKRVARSRHDEARWAEVAGPIRNQIRERQRKALVDFLVQRDALVENPNDLYAKMLIDVEMGPLQLTSRIVNANGSIQQFVQRSMLGLESSVWNLSEDGAREWRWMRSYRVWEANRKVFLYPENWIEPDLRDDKSPLFKALERQLRQAELTSASAEAAYKAYLEGLAEIADLEIVGLHVERQAGTAFSLFSGKKEETVHVFGRTKKPRRLFHRFRRDGVWSPWERLELDVESDRVLPMVWNGRLTLFWLVTEEIARGDNPVAPDPPIPAIREWNVGVGYCVRDAAGAWGRPIVLEHDYWIRTGTVPWSWQLFFTAEVSPNGDAELFLYGSNNVDSDTGQWTVKLGRFTAGSGNTKFVGARYAWVETNGLPSNGSILPAEPVIGMPMYVYDQRSSAKGSDGLYVRLQMAGGIPVDDPSLSNRPVFEVINQPRYFLTADRMKEPLHELPWAIYQDDSRALSLQRISKHSVDVVALPAPMEMVYFDYALESQTYRVELFSHPFVKDFRLQLGMHGLDGLLRWSDQGTSKLQLASRSIEPEVYVHGYAAEALPAETVDFNFGSANGIYNWELFFHAPFYIAVRLMRERRFEEAQKWFHYIFDPTDGSTGLSPQKYWKVKPFYENKNLADIITDMVASAAYEHAQHIGSWSKHEPSESLLNQIASWRRSPFSPHAIARLRPVAYQKAVVIRYIENLIAWGDQLFGRDSIESINEATQLYVMAQDLLGTRPATVKTAGSDSKTYENLAPDLDAFSNALVNVEPVVPPPPPAGAECGEIEQVPYGVWGSTYFCIPTNDKLLGLWDIVADRLFKIRNAQNIQGVFRVLPLFEPPIDPALLVRATAAGVDIASVLNDLNVAAPPYRYTVLYGKALEMLQSVQSLGSAVLSALERRDSEALQNLRAGHEVSTQEALREVRRAQLREAQESLRGLERRRQIIQERINFYTAEPEISDTEQAALDASGTAQELTNQAGGTRLLASTMAYIPEAITGAAGYSSPLGGFAFGGKAIAQSIEMSADATMLTASQQSHIAQTTATRAGYARRFGENQLQARLGHAELRELESQVEAARIRMEVGTHELALVERGLRQSKEVESFLRTKYTDEDLFDWMVAETSAVYFQAYSLAYEMAKRAQKAFQAERGDPSQTFIEFGAWDGLKRGLLAGERLAHDLRRMDAAYHLQNYRELELLKLVSLAEHDPYQLVRLREAGIAEVGLTEDDYDRDHPKHYMRRLKSASVTVPCTMGPYQGVHGTLELFNGATRPSPTATTNVYSVTSGAYQSVCTSQGQSDGGLFELSFRDERLLPFEGVGAHGEATLAPGPQWRFSLSQGNRFSFDSIDDLVLELRYTARASRTSAVPAPPSPRALKRLVRVQNEFAQQWQAFIEGGTWLELKLPLSSWMHGRNEALANVTQVEAFGWWSASPPPTAGMSVERPGPPVVAVTMGNPSTPFHTDTIPATAPRLWSSGALTEAVGTNDLWRFQPGNKSTLRDLWLIFTYTATAP